MKYATRAFFLNLDPETKLKRQSPYISHQNGCNPRYSPLEPRDGWRGYVPECQKLVISKYSHATLHFNKILCRIVIKWLRVVRTILWTIFEQYLNNTFNVCQSSSDTKMRGFFKQILLFKTMVITFLQAFIENNKNMLFGIRCC